MANVTKQDLIYEIARSTGYIQSDIRTVVEEFLSSVTRELDSSNTIEIRGFGTFSARKRLPRPARNPRTGEVVQLGERIAPLFKFSGELKQQINQVSAPLLTPQMQDVSENQSQS